MNEREQMAPKANKSLCSISSLFISLSLLCIFSLSFSFSSPNPPQYPLHISIPRTPQISPMIPSKSSLQTYPDPSLLEKYWSLNSDSRLGSEVDNEIRSTHMPKNLKYPPYPENPLTKQYSAEYWIMGDLMTPEEMRIGSFARRVLDVEEADVVFVPFFATLSAEIQLGVAKGVFRKKIGYEDYERQRKVVDFVKKTEAWKRSGGRDHVFVLTGYVKT